MDLDAMMKRFRSENEYILGQAEAIQKTNSKSPDYRSHPRRGSVLFDEEDIKQEETKKAKIAARRERRRKKMEIAKKQQEEKSKTKSKTNVYKSNSKKSKPKVNPPTVQTKKVTQVVEEQISSPISLSAYDDEVNTKDIDEFINQYASPSDIDSEIENIQQEIANSGVRSQTTTMNGSTRPQISVLKDNSSSMRSLSSTTPTSLSSSNGVFSQTLNSSIHLDHSQSPLPENANNPSMKRIMVAVRMRPTKPSEYSVSPKNINVSPLDKVVHIKNGKRTLRFDHVLGPSAQQEGVYQATTQSLVEDVPRGINSCVIAYGQTGAGKTYTLTELDGGENQGVLPRAISHLFETVENEKDIWDYKMTVSYLQIYMEVVYDLLRQHQKQLPVREVKNKVYVEGLSVHQVRNLNDVLKILDYGERSRMKAQTKFNRVSSRSHTLFVVTVERRHKTTGKILSAKFTCCDLAGSERAAKTKSQGQQFEEAKFINRSLSSLGNVIHALQDSSTKFIPWRDSKLTRLLQDSIGGNSRVSLIINISPDDACYQESLTSLYFGQRAMNVAVNPVVNEEIDFRALAISLQSQLDEIQSTKSKTINELVAQNESLENELMNVSQELEKSQATVQETMNEKEKYSSWYENATEKNLRLLNALKKSKEKVSQLEQYVSYLTSNEEEGINTSPTITEQEQQEEVGESLPKQHHLSATMEDTPTKMQSPMRSMASPAKQQVSSFITNEREQLLDQIGKEKKRNEQLENRLNLIDQNSSQLSKTVGLLTMESEKYSQTIIKLKSKLKKFKSSFSSSFVTLDRINTIFEKLHERHIVFMPQSVEKELQDYFKNKDTTKQQIPTLITNEEEFTLKPLEYVLCQLIYQMLEREKYMELLLQQLRSIDSDRVTEAIEKSLVDGAIPVVHNLALPLDSDLNHQVKQSRFKRWHQIESLIEELRGNLPQDSFFHTTDATLTNIHLQEHLKHLKRLDSESDDEKLDSTPDLFTRCMLNIEQKYAEFHDALAKLNSRVADKNEQIIHIRDEKTDLETANKNLEALVNIVQSDKNSVEEKLMALQQVLVDNDPRKFHRENTMLKEEIEFVRKEMENLERMNNILRSQNFAQQKATTVLNQGTPQTPVYSPSYSSQQSTPVTHPSDDPFDDMELVRSPLTKHFTFTAPTHQEPTISTTSSPYRHSIIPPHIKSDRHESTRSSPFAKSMPASSSSTMTSQDKLLGSRRTASPSKQTPIKYLRKNKSPRIEKKVPEPVPTELRSPAHQKSRHRLDWQPTSSSSSVPEINRSLHQPDPFYLTGIPRQPKRTHIQIPDKKATLENPSLTKSQLAPPTRPQPSSQTRLSRTQPLNHQRNKKDEKNIPTLTPSNHAPMPLLAVESQPLKTPQFDITKSTPPRKKKISQKSVKNSDSFQETMDRLVVGINEGLIDMTYEDEEEDDSSPAEAVDASLASSSNVDPPQPEDKDATENDVTEDFDFEELETDPNESDDMVISSTTTENH